ncbi:SseB family protein [Cellulomonas sp. ICMP 17802]|uniref:SseB family protein n=1 Tax=Cellulomonas sp. ICMP 17802 TaxID=3239199 RepID=UPI00351B9C2D
MKDFDQALSTAAPGTIDGAKLLARFAYEPLAVPSGGPVGEHFEGFIPAILDRDGVHHLVAFSSVQRFRDEGRIGGDAVAMPVREVLLRMPSDVGIVVNPGSSQGFELGPDVVATLRDELARPHDE